MLLEDKMIEDGRERNGRIVVITGEMFSGKTEELIRLLRRNIYAHVPFAAFKPEKDTRVGKAVKCRNGQTLEAQGVASSVEILEYVEAHPETRVIGVDEAQFFGPDDPIVEVVRGLADRQHLVVFIAGLDMDFTGKPFGHMPALMAIATEVRKIHAVCVECGRTAAYSRRAKEAGADQIVVGDSEYVAVCRRHR